MAESYGIAAVLALIVWVVSFIMIISIYSKTNKNNEYLTAIFKKMKQDIEQEKQEGN